MWTNKEPEIGQWNDFSMGKFCINKRIGKRYITDITFIFDNEWINKNTIFVTWDTQRGEYKTIKL